MFTCLSLLYVYSKVGQIILVFCNQFVVLCSFFLKLLNILDYLFIFLGIINVRV